MARDKVLKIHTLKELKVALYEGNAALQNRKLTDLEFTKLFFSKVFHEGEFDFISRPIYFQNKFNKQLSKLMNGKKDGMKELPAMTEELFAARPDLWEEICRRCRSEVYSAPEKDKFRNFLESIIVVDKKTREIIKKMRGTIKK